MLQGFLLGFVRLFSGFCFDSCCVVILTLGVLWILVLLVFTVRLHWWFVVNLVQSFVLFVRVYKWQCLDLVASVLMCWALRVLAGCLLCGFVFLLVVVLRIYSKLLVFTLFLGCCYLFYVLLCLFLGALGLGFDLIHLSCVLITGCGIRDFRVVGLLLIMFEVFIIRCFIV